MNLSNRTKNGILFAAVFFITAAVFSQNLIQPDPSRELKDAVIQNVEEWDLELALTSKQFDLMRRKLIEYAIKKDKLLQSKMREEAKTARLKHLQILENMDMRDILTKPQYDRYILILTQRVQNLKNNPDY